MMIFMLMIEDEYAGDGALGNRDVDEDGLAWL